MTPDPERWARDQLPVRELVPIRSRPWADVWRVETDEGVWWLKVNGTGTTYEPRLLEYLAGLGSALIPESVVHPDEPWSLIADGGQPLSEVEPRLTRAEQVDFWCTLMADYAALQQAAAARGRPDVGLPDFSPGQLLTRFDEVLASGWFRQQAARDLTPGQLDRIGHTRDALGPVARKLADGRPCSVQHDDLHGNNVLVDPRGPGSRPGARLIDWGDAVWAHPFGTLLITLRSLAEEWSVADDDPVLQRVRDAYLEPWRDRGESRAELADQLDLAVRSGGLLRAGCWVRALGTPNTTEAPASADALSGWLLKLAGALHVFDEAG